MSFIIGKSEPPMRFPMPFPMPYHPCEFDIPDGWLEAAGMIAFKPAEGVRSYRFARGDLIPASEIEPPLRSIAHAKDGGGFDRRRLVAVLRGIATDAEIEPVPLRRLDPPGEFDHSPYRYRVRDGYHRFYAVVAAGFECLPGEVS
jgi:hypothetical protein